jgi:hypothetical protein
VMHHLFSPFVRLPWNDYRPPAQRRQGAFFNSGSR